MLKLSEAAQGLILFVVYTTFIVGVFIWSGKSTEKTIYDRFIVSFEGTVIPYSDYDKTIQFYTNVLNFRPLTRDDEPDQKIVAVAIPGNKKLFLDPVSQRNSSATAGVPHVNDVVIRVRNGFDSLHKELTQRTTSAVSATPEQTAAGQTSAIYERPWGREFLVKDPHGNSLIFFQQRRRLRSRY